MSDEHWRIERMIHDRSGKVFRDPSRTLLIENSVRHWNAIRLESGTLVTWSPQTHSSRSASNRTMVRRTGWARAFSVSERRRSRRVIGAASVEGIGAVIILSLIGDIR